jgi:hypothetical protein
MAQYQAYLNDLMLTHNLDNNSGVVTGVLAEAQEQVGAPSWEHHHGRVPLEFRA